MDNIYQFPELRPIVRILQITDPHLFSTNDGQLLGVNTSDSFQAVLEAILNTSFQPQENIHNNTV